MQVEFRREDQATSLYRCKYSRWLAIAADSALAQTPFPYLLNKTAKIRSRLQYPVMLPWRAIVVHLP